MHGHALSISNSIGDVHKLILVNLELTNKNVDQLGDAQKMLDKVTPHARKPSCICNVVLCTLISIQVFFSPWLPSCYSNYLECLIKVVSRLVDDFSSFIFQFPHLDILLTKIYEKNILSIKNISHI